jgi:hypothetical protein
MIGLNPELADGAANMARADNPDLDLWARGRLTDRRGRPYHCLHNQCSRTAQQRAATGTKTDMLQHQHTATTCESIVLRPCDMSLRLLAPDGRRVYFGWGDGAAFIFFSGTGGTSSATLHCST